MTTCSVDKFNVNHATIFRIWHGETWKDEALGQAEISITHIPLNI